MRLVAIALATASATAQSAPVAYTLDPAHTQVQFSWNHLQYSNPQASFDDVSGTLMWDEADITNSSVDVTMGVASVHSHVAALDAKLTSAEFLDAGRFPQVRFVSSGVARSEPSDVLKVSGKLTVHGVTREVTLDARLNHVGQYPMLEVPAAGFDATAVIRRSDFGVSAGIPGISDELRVRITAEALEAAGYARAIKALAGQSQETSAVEAGAAHGSR